MAIATICRYNFTIVHPVQAHSVCTSFTKEAHRTPSWHRQALERCNLDNNRYRQLSTGRSYFSAVTFQLEHRNITKQIKLQLAINSEFNGRFSYTTVQCSVTVVHSIIIPGHMINLQNRPIVLRFNLYKRHHSV